MVVLIHNTLLVMHVVCSFCVLIWCKYFRAITKLIIDIQSMRLHQDALVKINENPLMSQGEDFLFLFDLLSHSCGVESTLRVLTHSDADFHEIFKPNIHPSNHLSLEEDRLKIMWYPADIEKWLHSSRSRYRVGSIEIDSYEVTIFPAERFNSTQTVSSHSKRLLNKGNMSGDEGSGGLDDSAYSAWFYDLDGGRTEYVITIACMIGKSRMKGEKVVSNLVPYGPEKPRAGMVKLVEVDHAEIQWDSPKGDFTKYNLVIEKISHLKITSEELQKQGLRRFFSRQSGASSSSLHAKVIQKMIDYY